MSECALDVLSHTDIYGHFHGENRFHLDSIAIIVIIVYIRYHGSPGRTCMYM